MPIEAPRPSQEFVSTSAQHGDLSRDIAISRNSNDRLIAGGIAGTLAVGLLAASSVRAQENPDGVNVDPCASASPSASLVLESPSGSPFDVLPSASPFQENPDGSLDVFVSPPPSAGGDIVGGEPNAENCDIDESIAKTVDAMNIILNQPDDEIRGKIKPGKLKNAFNVFWNGDEENKIPGYAEELSGYVIPSFEGMPIDEYISLGNVNLFNKDLDSAVRFIAARGQIALMIVAGNTLDEEGARKANNFVDMVYDYSVSSIVHEDIEDVRSVFNASIVDLVETYITKQYNVPFSSS